jgi:hypothetical protein
MKKRKEKWGGGKVTKIAGMNLTPMNPSKSITVEPKTKPKVKPKEKTIKQLQAECKKRNIGFMTSWSRMALIKRLDDEDKKDDEIKALRSMLEEKEKSHKHEVHLVERRQRKPLEVAQTNLKQNKILLEGYEKRIKELKDEKFELMQKSMIIRREVSQLEILIKSLI